MSEIRASVEHCVCDGMLSWSDQLTIARQYGVSVAYIEAVALERGILPARYQRNRNMLNCRDQQALFSSHVAVVGCGGLGGYIIEELARIGIGHLTVIDPDIFEEHNLNRQILSTPADLGHDKVAVAVRRVAEVNPAVTVTPIVKALSRNNGCGLLAGSQVVVDGLDNIDTRLELSDVCETLELPLVHGAIAGWYGHVTSQMPGDTSLKTLYGQKQRPKGIEGSLGNPSFTPSLIASVQVAEVIKILLNHGEPLRHRLFTIDLLDMECIETPL